MNWDAEEDWLALHHRLVIHAHRRCLQRVWRKGSLQNLPGGNSPETIANEAVVRWLAGERVWGQEPYPGDDPVEFLKGVVDSLISDLVRGAEHKSELPLVSRPGAEQDGGACQREIGTDEATIFNPPHSSPEESAYFGEILRRVQVLVSDDADLMSWFAYSCAGMKACEIAAAMGISVQKAYPLRRRFLRRIKDALDEW